MKENLNIVLGKKVQKIRLILNFAKNDFIQRYVASSLGIIWGFIPSIMTVLVYWFIFTVAFKASNSSEPYLVWLVSGMVPWFFFSEAIMGVTGGFIEYSYLVKKVVFDINILPSVKIVSSFFTHVFFVFILIYILLFYGYLPTWGYMELLYYVVCLIAFTTALGRITATFNVLFRDMSNLVAVVLQFGVWILPILWNTSDVAPIIVKILKINPMFYIIQGYRDCLIYNKSIMMHISYGVYFWLVTILLSLFGRRLLKNIQGQFADLL